MAQAHTYYIPQFAAGAAGGLTITTTVTIVNLGTEVLNPALFCPGFLGSET